MAVMYVPAAARDLRRHTERIRRLDERHAVLAATSLVALLAIALSFGGRLATHARADASSRTAAIVDLDLVSDARALEPALEPVFVSTGDRRFAAEHLAAFVRSLREQGGHLPNVGALLGARVDADAIDRAGVVEYKERLRDARDRAARRGEAPTAWLPVLRASDLAAVKPSLVVR